MSTNGLGWTAAESWLETSTPCDWLGVSCDNDHVVEIDLSGNALTGSLPPTIGALSRLAALDLSDNQITGSIPRQIGNLGLLTSIDLSANDISGVVPVSVAEVGAGAAICNFTGNNSGLCIPDSAPYLAIQSDPICGMSLTSGCGAGALVEVLSFAVLRESNGWTFSWTTDRAADGVSFAVEQMIGDGFTSIASLETRDESDTAYEVSIGDLDPGLYTFRLKQTDAAGFSIFTDPIQAFAANGELFLGQPYPNPTTTAASFRFASVSQQRLIANLYDHLGRHVRTLFDAVVEAETPTSATFDAHGLADGAYYIRLRGEVGGSAVSSVVVVR